jgi:hypothetical protein
MFLPNAGIYLQVHTALQRSPGLRPAQPRGPTDMCFRPLPPPPFLRDDQSRIQLP